MLRRIDSSSSHHKLGDAVDRSAVLSAGHGFELVQRVFAQAQAFLRRCRHVCHASSRETSVALNSSRRLYRETSF